MTSAHQSQIDVGTLRAYLLFEVSGRLHATALPPISASYSAVFIGCFNHNAAGPGGATGGKRREKKARANGRRIGQPFHVRSCLRNPSLPARII